MMKKVLKAGCFILIGCVVALAVVPSADYAASEETNYAGFWEHFFGQENEFQASGDNQSTNGFERPQKGHQGLSDGMMPPNGMNKPPEGMMPPDGEDGPPEGMMPPDSENRPPKGENGQIPKFGEGQNTQMNGKMDFDFNISEEDNATNTVSTIENQAASLTYPIVDTNQTVAFDNYGKAVDPVIGDDLYGQDANYEGYQPDYVDNGDGTISDEVTGLMWQKDPGDKMGLSEAMEGANDFDLAGYDDWRLPTIKELYSLIQFSGTDPNVESTDGSGLVPFIDTDYFDFVYGDTDDGERIIDSQFASSTIYESTTMNGEKTVFGVNFADGRIKGYPVYSKKESGEKQFYVLYVRGNSDYGENDFIDNGDGTITDLATGLMWMQDDSGEAMNWSDALQWSESLETAGYEDWRLPDAKELQSIVDYTRSPATTDSAAIDQIFNISTITDEGGEINYPFFWSSTTHISSSRGGKTAVYVAFGEALGFMSDMRTGEITLMDVHGAGAQRSDSKIGDPEDYATGHGPQGDVVRIYNYARAVRSVEIEE